MKNYRVAVLLLLLAAIPAFGQPPAPAAPQKYKVTLRYYIPEAQRDQHVAHYDAMIAHLVKIGFEFDPPLEKHPDTDREDRTKNYLTGYIGPGNLRRVLDPLVVQSALVTPFAPEEFKLPEDGDAPVTVRLDLAGNLPPDRQRELANQTRVLLRELGFKEPAGYDHRGPTRRPYTRIVGTIPGGKLDLLNRDLRKQPAGWLGPIIKPNEIPSPLRDLNPVQLIEVLPDGAAVKDLPEPEFRGVEENEKISADLWALVRNKDVPATQVRVQIGFVVGTDQDREWKTILRESTPGFFIEGKNGPYVTGLIRLDQVKTLAQSALVNFIRLPRAPLVHADPTVKIKGDNAKALEQSGVQELHTRGYLGKGVRIGVLDRDFRGWEELGQDEAIACENATRRSNHGGRPRSLSATVPQSRRDRPRHAVRPGGSVGSARGGAGADPHRCRRSLSDARFIALRARGKPLEHHGAAQRRIDGPRRPAWRAPGVLAQRARDHPR